MKNVTLRQLRTFNAVARHLSFARAAGELHLTPPAVSMQIGALEAAAGLPLFERSGRNITLTLTGEYLLVYTRKMLATLKEADDALARLRGLKGGRVTLGMVSTAEYFLPRLLAQFRVAHPGIDFRLSVGNREQLVQRLQANEVDLAVMGRPPRELATRAEPFAAHPHAIVSCAEHLLADLPAIAPATLQSEQFIVREPGSGTRALMEHFFKEQRIAPQVVMEMSSNETIKQAVIAGMGIAFISLHTVSLELAVGQIRVLNVNGLPLIRRWHIVNTQSKLLSPAAEALRYFVLEAGEKMLAAQFSAAALPGKAVDAARISPDSRAVAASDANEGKAGKRQSSSARLSSRLALGKAP